MGGLGQFNETERTLPINTSASGNITVIPAPGAGKRIYIDHVNIVPGGTTNVTFFNGASAMTGAYPLALGGGLSFDNSCPLEHGILECADNTALIINNSSPVSLQGFVRYRINNE